MTERIADALSRPYCWRNTKSHAFQRAVVMTAMSIYTQLLLIQFPSHTWIQCGRARQSLAR